MDRNDFSIRAEYKRVFTDTNDVYTIGPDGDGKFAVRKNGEYIPGSEIPIHASVALREHGLSLTTIEAENNTFQSARSSGYNQAREEIREQIIEYFGKPKPDQVQQIDKVNDLLDALSLPEYQPKRTFSVTAKKHGETVFALTVLAEDESEAIDIAQELVDDHREYEAYQSVDVNISFVSDDDRVVSVEQEDAEIEINAESLVDEVLDGLTYRATEEL